MRTGNDLTELRIHRALQAVHSGEKDEAVKCIEQLWEEGRMVQNLLTEIISSLLTFMAKKNGEETVEEAWRYAANDYWRPMLMALKDAGPDKLMEAYLTLHRALGSDFYVKEDEDKMTVHVASCGSGGRMMKEGKYDNTDRHPMNGGTTKNGYAWSCYRPGIPYYCVHAPLMFHILPKEWGWDVVEFEYGRQFDGDGNPVEEPCKVTIYKKPR